METYSQITGENARENQDSGGELPERAQNSQARFDAGRSISAEAADERRAISGGTSA